MNKMSIYDMLADDLNRKKNIFLISQKKNYFKANITGMMSDRLDIAKICVVIIGFGLLI